jgi:hypothetical protein
MMLKPTKSSVAMIHIAKNKVEVNANNSKTQWASIIT